MSDVNVKIRCPSCRGAKKIPKLGGVIGECNTCNGDGKINACDKPVMIVQEPVTAVSEVMKAVAESVPMSGRDKFEGSVFVDEPQTKIDRKKAVYKRKTQGSVNHGAL